MQGQPAAVPASHRVSSHCLGAFPCTILENHVQRGRGSFVFYFPGGIEGSGVPVVLTQHVSSATHKSFTSSCLPSVGLAPSCCMNITNYHQNLCS